MAYRVTHGNNKKACEFCFLHVSKGTVSGGNVFCNNKCRDEWRREKRQSCTVAHHPGPFVVMQTTQVSTPGPVSVVYACRGCNGTFIESSKPKVVINGHNYCGVACFQTHPPAVMVGPGIMVAQQPFVIAQPGFVMAQPGFGGPLYCPQSFY